jgi:hypothetical protein
MIAKYEQFYIIIRQNITSHGIIFVQDERIDQNQDYDTKFSIFGNHTKQDKKIAMTVWIRTTSASKTIGPELALKSILRAFARP